LSTSAKSHRKKDTQGLQESKGKGTRVVQNETYISHRPDVLPDHTRVRASPISEMALWKRFLARGDNTWQGRGVEKS
jgi:hypothetical protein